MSGPLVPDDPRHGTRHGYNLGCRCDECRATIRAYMRQWVAQQTPPPPGDRRHGAQGYADYGCRCDICREGHREKMSKHQAARVARGLAAGDPRHGTTNGYGGWGCRCDECREAIRVYQLRKRGTS